jgi:hypothetical protein
MTEMSLQVTGATFHLLNLRWKADILEVAMSVSLMGTPKQYQQCFRDAWRKMSMAKSCRNIAPGLNCLTGAVVDKLQAPRAPTI